jgi:hypothetical protein
MARSIAMSGDVGCDQHDVGSQPIADQIGRTSAPRC